jgi:hypothetical protein
MVRKIMVLVLLALCASSALAQKGHSKDLQGEFFGSEAFLGNVKFIAGTYGAELTLARYPDTDCLPGTLNVTCFPITDPDALMTPSSNDQTRIVIPGKTAHNALFFEARNFTTLWYRDDLQSPENAEFAYVPTITIESDALAAPITAGMGRRRVTRMIWPGEDGNDDLQYAREYRLTRSLMKEGMGLSDAVIDAFFAGPITIRLNVRLRAREVNYVDGLFDLMVYGN